MVVERLCIDCIHSDHWGYCCLCEFKLRFKFAGNCKEYRGKQMSDEIRATVEENVEGGDNFRSFLLRDTRWLLCASLRG